MIGRARDGAVATPCVVGVVTEAPSWRSWNGVNANITGVVTSSVNSARKLSILTAAGSSGIYLRPRHHQGR